MRRLLISLLAVLLLTACASLSPLVEPPQLSIAGVEISSVSMQGAELLFNLQIHNPNRFELRLQGIDYGLQANGRKVFSGTNQQSLLVPAQQGGQIQLPVSISYKQVFDSIAAAFQAGRISYELQGSADLGLFQVPFKRNGEFDLNLHQ